MNNAQSIISNDDYWTGDDTIDGISYGGMYMRLGGGTGYWRISSPSAYGEQYTCMCGWSGLCLTHYKYYFPFGPAGDLCPLVSLKSTFIPQISSTN